MVLIFRGRDREFHESALARFCVVGLKKSLTASSGDVYRVETLNRLTASCERDRGEFWTLSRSAEVMAEIRFLGAGAAADQSESEFPLRNAADSDVLIFYRRHLSILLLINLLLRGAPSTAITGQY